MTLHFLNDVANDAESTQKYKKIIIASLKRKTIGKLINSFPDSRLFDIKFTRLDFENAC